MASDGAEPAATGQGKEISNGEGELDHSLDDAQYQKAQLEDLAENWSDWKEIAGRKPPWSVPTSIEIKSKLKFANVGIFYHCPQSFNIDVYHSENGNFDGGLWLYYYDCDGSGGWRTTSGNLVPTRKNGVADPKSNMLGGGAQSRRAAGARPGGAAS